jgi:hypothetical protein
LGEHDDAIFIFLVLAINTTVGAAQEVRAEVALATASGLRPIARMQAGKAGSGIRASRHETGKRLRADSEIPGERTLTSGRISPSSRDVARRRHQPWIRFVSRASAPMKASACLSQTEYLNSQRTLAIRRVRR